MQSGNMALQHPDQNTFVYPGHYNVPDILDGASRDYELCGFYDLSVHIGSRSCESQKN